MDIENGLFFWIGGMLLALALCVRGWDKGFAYRYAPPIYGTGAGIILAAWWRKPTSTFIDVVETVLVFAITGWGFWFAVWLERRDWKGEKNK